MTFSSLPVQSVCAQQAELRQRHSVSFRLRRSAASATGPASGVHKQKHNATRLFLQVLRPEKGVPKVPARENGRKLQQHSEQLQQQRSSRALVDQFAGLSIERLARLPGQQSTNAAEFGQFVGAVVRFAGGCSAASPQFDLPESARADHNTEIYSKILGGEDGRR